jgi:ABC-type uncharacterized transport system substrate-binding protein
MRRRCFAALIGATAALGPLAAFPQQKASGVPLLGWLGFQDDGIARDGLRQGLRELGYIEGQSIAIEYRFPESGDDFAGPVQQLARLNVQLILTAGVPAADAVQRAGLTIPVVFVVADPIGSGFARRLSHPGGNMTGLSLAVEEQFSGKWLELIKETVPRLSEVAYLWNPTNHSSASSWKAMQELAPRVGLTLASVELRDPRDIELALAMIMRDGAEGVIVDSDATMIPNQARIVAFAITHRLPLISSLRRYVDSGGLMSYGPSLEDLWRRAAIYVDKILNGAKPADLPVEQPTRFQLIVNLKTAEAIDVAVPQSVLARADEIIE